MYVAFDLARVYVMIEFSYEREDMCYFAFICAKVLKYILRFIAVFCWRAITQKGSRDIKLYLYLLRYGAVRKTVIQLFLKFQNFDANVGKITHITPLIREFYHNEDSSYPISFVMHIEC